MKCIVIETSPERTNAHPVTNENGTPHIYATMAEARAELRANGYIYNRANQRYYINGTEYRAYILRADSEEYAEIVEQAEQQAAPDIRAKFDSPYLIWEDDSATETPENYAAHTSTEYLFSELSPEAQARAISDAIEEEQRTAYEWGSHTYFDIEEILECVADLGKQQPVEVSQDYGCNWYGTARGTNYYWHHPADWESVTEATDNGICWSMDMCDKWNEYAPRIIALQEAHEEATEQADVFWSIVSDANWDKYDAETDAERERLEVIEHAAAEAAGEIDDMRDRIENAAEELTEDAAHAVGNVVDGLIESQYEYNTSPEFWRYWLNDGETRFTRDGERI